MFNETISSQKIKRRVRRLKKFLTENQLFPKQIGRLMWDLMGQRSALLTINFTTGVPRRKFLQLK